MAAKRKDKKPSPAATYSPRKTRSATAGPRLRSTSATGKRAAPPSAPAASPVKKRKVTTVKRKAKESNDVAPAVPPPASADGSAKNIIIEACKQCNSFKTRAMTVKDGLESAIPGITVAVNPEKPRRGCFEIRDASGEIFVSLLNMPRPFTPMKELNMDEVISDIIEKIK